MNYSKNWREKISSQLLRSIFGLYFLVAVLVTVIQISLELKNVKQNIIGQLISLEDSFGPALRTALWEQNDLAVTSIIKGVTKNEFVSGMDIFDEFGELLSHEGITKQTGKVSWIDQNFSHEFEIFYDKNGKDMKVGKTVIYSSNQIIITRIKYSLILIIINSFIKTAVLWLIMIYFINRLLEKPLDKLTKEVKSVEMDNIKKIDPVTENKNQLSVFVDAFNDLLERLKGYKEQVQYNHKNLEKKVKSRTKELETALEEVKVMKEVKEQFLSNISHEIRTPLNGIIGFSDILENHLDLSVEDRVSYASELKSSAKNLLKVLNNIIDLSKLNTNKITFHFGNFNLKDMTNDLLMMFSSQAKEKNIDLKFEYEEDLLENIYFDEQRLRQALFNIIHNAVKFTKKGFIKLSVRTEGKSSTSDIRDLVITIEDSGVGIPEDQISRVFESFVQSRGQSINDYDGTGIGLSLSSEIINKMNGKVQVQSEEGKGTRFIIHLPEIQFLSLKKEEKIHALDVRKVQFKPATVLCIEDIKVGRDVINSFLARQSHIKIIMAENGREGYDLAVNEKPDLILCDISLPEMNGFELATKLKHDGHNFKIIAITAIIDEDTAEEEIQVFNDLLFKPISKADLIKAMARLLPYDEVEGIAKVQEEGEKLFDEPQITDQHEFDNQLRVLLSFVRHTKQTQTLNDLEELYARCDTFCKFTKWKAFHSLTNEISKSLSVFEMTKLADLLDQLEELLESQQSQAA